MNYKEILPQVDKLIGKKAILLLGTDQYIGEGLDNKEIETRVGVIPEQIEAISNWLQSNGIALDFYFIKGSGTRANYPDSAYLKIGGHVIFEHELTSIPAPYVVHALKEPSSYEAFIPGPFLRIGALHSSAFNDSSGVAFLFKRRNFSAIFDGSNIGAERNIPIRGAMSIFAGEIAADFCIKHFNKNAFKNEKVIISGGGVVGLAAINKFISEIKDKCTSIIVFEPNEQRVSILKEKFKHESIIHIEMAGRISSAHVENASAIILTAFVKGQPAPDVLFFNDIIKMKEGSIIVDVSIDEKGGIKLDDFDKINNPLPLVVNKLKNAISGLGKKIKYIADDHLPKHKPEEASRAHGEAIMPYIGLLLYFCAKLGGPRQAAKYILKGDFSDQRNEQVKELLMHLKRGLAFYSPAPLLYNKNIISDESNKVNLENFLNSAGIEFNSFD